MFIFRNGVALVRGNVALTLLFLPALPAQEPVPYRVLVRASAAAEGAKGLTEVAARTVRQALQAHGEIVLSPEQVAAAAHRNRDIQAQDANAKAEQAQRLLALTDADVLVDVRVTVESAKPAQGRYVVRDVVGIEVSSVGSTTQDLEDQGAGEGRSIESYASAHGEALAAALGNRAEPASLLGKLVATLDRRRSEEAKHGIAYTLTVHSELQTGGHEVLGATELREIPGIDADSFALSSATAAHSIYRMRFHGRNDALRDRLYAAIAAKRGAVREATQRNLTADIWMSRGSCDVVLRLTPPQKVSLDKVLESTMTRIVEPLYQRGPQWYDGTKPRFQPAFIPAATERWNSLVTFVGSYWGAYDRVAKAHPDLTDPLDYESSVEVAGHPFKSLRTAKEEAERLAADYYASPIGQKAQDIARFAEEALRKASEGRVNGQVDDMVQSSILYTIKSDAELFREESAVDQSSIQWFTRQGTDRLVITRLTRPLDSFRLEVIVVDVANGLKQAGSAELDPMYTEELTQVLAG